MTDLITVIVVVAGTLGGMAMGNRYRQQCKHVWETLEYRIVNVYEDANREDNKNKVPISRRTEVTQACEKCGEPRVLTLNGFWDPTGKRKG